MISYADCPSCNGTGSVTMPSILPDALLPCEECARRSINDQRRMESIGYARADIRRVQRMLDNLDPEGRELQRHSLKRRLQSSRDDLARLLSYQWLRDSLESIAAKCRTAGWDGYDGQPVPIEAIALCYRALERCERAHESVGQVVAVSGGVQWPISDDGEWVTYMTIREQSVSWRRTRKPERRRSVKDGEMIGVFVSVNYEEAFAAICGRPYAPTMRGEPHHVPLGLL